MRYNIGVEDTEFFSENRKHDNALGPTERRPPPNDSANFQILPPIRPRFSDPPQNVTDWMFCVSSFLHPVLKSIFFIFLDILDYKLSCWQVCKKTGFRVFSNVSTIAAFTVAGEIAEKSKNLKNIFS